MALRTPLYSEHTALGARLVEFGGWDMPVCYSTITDEHNNVRKNAGLFDICHMGEIFVEGNGSIDFLQKIITNDLNKLSSGKAFYTCMCNDSGGVLDDLFVYKFNDDKFMMVVNAANIEKDFNWLASHSFGDVVLTNKSDETAKLDLQGPNSQQILQKLTQFDLSGMNRFSFAQDTVNDVDAIISRTGYTAEDGFEIYFEASKAAEIWRKLLDEGKEHGLKPIGLGARDTLRTEACYSLYGHELNEEITPLEADVGFVVKLNKEFIGKGALLDAPKRKVVAFEMKDKLIGRNGYEVFYGNKKIGSVTSGTFSPTFQKSIGMAMIDIDFARAGTVFDIIIRDKMNTAEVVPKPIYKYVRNFSSS